MKRAEGQGVRILAEHVERLARYFGSAAQGSLNLQMTYDLKTAERANAKAIARQITPREPVAV